MTIPELKRWQFEKNLENQWWLSLDGRMEDLPLDIEAIEEILSKPFLEAKVCHKSQAGLPNPPWIEVASVTPQSYGQVTQVTPHNSTQKSRLIYIVLALFLGALGIHNFYAGYTSKGLIQLLATVLTGWLVLPLIAVFIWSLIDICTVTKEANGVPMTN